MKDQFLNSELWTLTVGAAFQRSHLYKDNVPNEEKKKFKDATRNFIENTILPHYKEGKVNEENHVQYITDLSDFTTGFSSIFQKGRMNFGISQKMLNLHLKYQWCKGAIAAPPHFPVDRIIQEELNKVARDNQQKAKKIEAWTQFEDETKYLDIINFAKEMMAIESSLMKFSLPEVELYLFDRR
ncbi:MAG: hypothetical protein V7670_03225 [Maribacter arcticus]|uniref:hypothetical protein n=1 Tax=Maribacter arcticus TaxID=561365 RepID=UPI003003209A